MAGTHTAKVVGVEPVGLENHGREQKHVLVSEESQDILELSAGGGGTLVDDTLAIRADHALGGDNQQET